MIDFKVTGVKKKISYSPNPKFGTCFTPNYLRMDINSDDLEKPTPSRLTAEIRPFGSEPFSPATISLHYGQSIFEGLKAYRMPDGSVAAFRPYEHAIRFRNSAKKMAMADLREEIFMECLEKFVSFEQDNVPSEAGHALYIRPFMIGKDEVVKVGRSQKYTFYILTAIAGDYFAGHGDKAPRVLVNREFVRAFPGGTGEAKTAGNYAASLGPQAYASTLGCDQVLYLDARNHDFVDELGGMNFFAVRGNELITPPLTGTILPGITRKSILQLAADIGLKASEKPISFTTLKEEIKSGVVTEVFACGTAAVVSPLGELAFQDKVGDTPEIITLEAGRKGRIAGAPISNKMLEHLSNVQRGIVKAPEGWLHKIR